MGNATSTFNLIRNVGAAWESRVHDSGGAQRAELDRSAGSARDRDQSAIRAMLEATRQTLMAHGVHAAVATRRAYALMFASIERQAAILPFLKIFRVLAFIFVAVIPLLC